MADEISIGTVGNYYGGLAVKAEDGKYWWSIENYDGHCWYEIPFRLYIELINYEENRPKEDYE